MIKRLIACAMLVLALCLVVLAGYEHIGGGQTVWVNRPSPATCWLRQGNGDLYPASKIQVFDDTIRHYVDGLHDLPSLGFWAVDADGDYYPNAEITSGNCTTNANNLRGIGEWNDVEWDVDGDGDLVPKL